MSATGAPILTIRNMCTQGKRSTFKKDITKKVRKSLRKVALLHLEMRQKGDATQPNAGSIV